MPRAARFLPLLCLAAGWLMVFSLAAQDTPQLLTEPGGGSVIASSVVNRAADGRGRPVGWYDAAP